MVIKREFCCKKMSETMDKSEEPRLSPYERRLQAELEIIELKLAELTNDRSALRRQITKARIENHQLRDVNRKNSVGRILIENKVLEALKGASKPMTTKQLYEVGRLMNFELRENTFRTNLHRMKAKGLVENAGRGRWRGVQKTKPDQLS
jgi:hypothetical protein